MNIPVDIAMRDLDSAKRSIQDVELTVKTLGDELDLFRSTIDDIESLPRFSIVTDPAMSRMMNKAPEGEWLKWSDVSKLLGDL